MKSYESKFGIESMKKVVTNYEFDSCDTVKKIEDHSGFFIFDQPYVKSFLVGVGDFITIATDGLTQYMDEKKNPIDVIKMVPLILDYPNFNGVFVERTMNFLKKDLIRKSWSHSDDIGLATIVNI